jgi:hypothetical protein
VLPTVQSRAFEFPGTLNPDPKNPVASASGLLLVFASPAQTRTMMRLVLGKVVS